MVSNHYLFSQLFLAIIIILDIVFLLYVIKTFVSTFWNRLKDIRFSEIIVSKKKRQALTD